MMVNGIASFLANSGWITGTAGLSISTLPLLSRPEDSPCMTISRENWLGRTRGALGRLSLFGPEMVGTAIQETDIWEQRGTEAMIYFLEWADRTAPWLLLIAGGFAVYALVKKREYLKNIFPWQQRFSHQDGPQDFDQKALPQQETPAQQKTPVQEIPKQETEVDPSEKMATPVYISKLPVAGEAEIKGPEVAKNPDGTPQIPGYEILRKLGHGGMGDVYLAAKGDLLNLKFAIKVLAPRLLSDEKALARFRREADMYCKLDCRNVVKLHHYGFAGDQPFMVLEYVEGGNLDSWIQSKSLDSVSIRQVERQAARIMLGCLDGLEIIDHAGLVHRDIKPLNIFLDEDGVPKLGDFGLARPTQDYRITQGNLISGTVPYLSPSMLRGEEFDIRDDLYSLAVTLFEMLTKRFPFQLDEKPESQDTNAVLMLKIITAPVPDPRQFNPFLSEEISGIILKAMSKEKQERYQTPSEFKEALLDFLRKSEVANNNSGIVAPETMDIWRLKE